MKQMIERTNTSTKRFSTRTIAMVLSIVMLIGSIATGSMLSTFAAYLQDAAQADAVTQAAAQGGNIALNAIPSEDNADDAEAKPDLSGFEENEIVRGMKSDLAGTGANADLAGTGNNEYYHEDLYIDLSNLTTRSLNLVRMYDDYSCTSYKGQVTSSGITNLGNNIYRVDLSSGNYNSYLYARGFEVETNIGSTYYNYKIGVVNGRLDNKLVIDSSGNFSWGVYYPAFALHLDKGSGFEKYSFNTSGKIDIDLSASTNYQFYVEMDNNYKYFKNTGTMTSSNCTGWTFTTSASGNAWITSSETGQYSFTMTVSGGDVKLSATYPEGKMYVYGEPKGESSWSTSNIYEMTYDGNGIYHFTVTDSVTTPVHYRVKYGTYYFKVKNDSEDEAAATSQATAKEMYRHGTEDAGKSFWFNPSGSEYTIYVDKNAYPSNTHGIKSWIEYGSMAALHFYLTGWLNDASETGTTNEFTMVDDNTYTLSWTATGDRSGYQYATIWDGTNAYHPASHKSGSGTAYSTTDSSPGDDNKWMVAAASGKTVSFTWSRTSSSANWTLSWTVSGSGGDSGLTPTSYKLLYGTSNNFTTFTARSETVYLKDGKYYVNLSDFTGSMGNGNHYFALSSSSSYTGIIGYKTGSGNSGDPGAAYTETDTDGYISGGTQSYNTGGGDNKMASFVYITRQNTALKGLTVSITPGTAGGNTDYHFTTSNAPIVDGDGGDAAKTVLVYAKDGAAPLDWDNKTSGGASDVTDSATKYNYAAIATTTISQIDGTAPAAGKVTTVDCGTSDSDTYRSQYQTATVETGKSIQITTTIADHLTWRSRYYVRGWCINGVTYTTNGKAGVNTAKNADGIYTMTYTIPEKISTDYLEITPIYYLQDTSKCITFYLEGFDENIQSTGGWGNTPYIYPFYGNNDNVDNSFGVYPGQPMVYADGKYSIEIPMINLLIDSGRTKHNKTDIKGITISNGYADHVHRNLIYSWTDHDNDADHKQTYDYDDFYKIYKECTKNSSGIESGAPNSIIFRIMDESNTYNRETYGGSKSGARVIATQSSLNSTDMDNIDSGNGWELLTNRYGDPIDLFGTKVSAPATAATSMDNNALRVVSTGYNANIAGDYGTAWKVYKYTDNTKFDLIQDSANGRFAAPPSIFLLRGNASGYAAAVDAVGYPAASHSVTGVGSYTDDIDKYEGIYQSAQAYANKPVYITYEKNAQDTRDDATGTGAYRVDGRWYYTHSNDKVQSVVEIETKDKSTGNWVKDTFTPDAYATTTGSTGNTVEFSNGTRQSDSVDNDGAHTITFTATPGTGYEFDSWWIKYSDTNYVKIEGAGATHTMTATASDTLVARFLPASSGELTIKHTKQGTGEGTIDMDVKVYTNSSKGTVVDNGSFTGNYVNIPSTIISNNAEHLNYYIEVTLKATPKYDGTVSSFTYDKFNANPSSGSAITAAENKSTTPATSTFGFTISQLYLGNVSLDTTELNYVSIIDAEDHFYEFTYEYKDRGGDDKSYTTRGTIKLTDYKTYVGDTNHVLDAAFVKAKAPFESNFLKNNTLTVPDVSYTAGTKTFSVTATFTQTDSLPEYTVKFMLPYEYYTAKGDDYKQYTVKPNNSGSKVYDNTKVAFELKAKYDQFVTVDATIEQAGSQTRVSKVTDATDVNHVGNDFFTAPEQLVSSDGSTTYYFQYWQIQRLADKDQASAPVVSKIYFPDLNYRIYGDYYIEPKYSTNAADWWHNTYINSSNSTDSSILYLGDSRNQWNLNGVSTDSASSDVASDKIYSDFMLAFNDKGAELKGSSAVKIGMIIERVVDNSGTTKKWATGSADVSDMNYYKTKDYGTGYDEAAVKTAIADDLNNNKRANASNIGRSGCVGVDLSTANLNNKNYIETNYSIFSQYGQNVEDHSIEFATDNAIDNYVYRAYAVIKGADGTWYVSDAAYFCTRYTANLKYSE